MLSSKAIGEKAALILQDAGYVRWTVPNLAKWINAASRELVRLKPTALTATASLLLSPGTKQSLSGATFKATLDGAALSLIPLQLMEVIRNMGATGTTPGTAVTGIERKTLDVMLPGWHASPAGEEILFTMFDPKDPLTFYNYPAVPATGSRYIEVLVSRKPVNSLLDEAAELGTDDIDPDLSEIYEDVLVDGTLAYAFSEDGESPVAGQRAAYHAQRFQQALGVKFKNEVSLAPREQFQPQGGQ